MHSKYEFIMKGIYYPIAQRLHTFCEDGQFVIWRDAFRWKRHEPDNEYGDPVMSNHYDSMSLDDLSEAFGYEIDWEFNLKHVAIVRKKS